MVEMTTCLWLVRHGATDWSDAGRINGLTDTPLNEAGRDQARRLRFLRSIGFTGVWTSDLVRATETADIALDGATADPRLRELDFGEIEGLTWDECSVEMQGALVAFDAFTAPRGESTGHLTKRALDFLAALSEGDHLLFTHGGVIRAICRRAGEDIRIEPGGLVRIDRDSRGLFAPPLLQPSAEKNASP